MKDYVESMKEYYQNYFRHCSASSLVLFESHFSKLIDDDFFEETLLIDDVLMLYELVRDECVRRVALMVHTPV